MRWSQTYKINVTNDIRKLALNSLLLTLTDNINITLPDKTSEVYNVFHFKKILDFGKYYLLNDTNDENIMSVSKLNLTYLKNGVRYYFEFNENIADSLINFDETELAILDNFVLHEPNIDIIKTLDIDSSFLIFMRSLLTERLILPDIFNPDERNVIDNDLLYFTEGSGNIFLTNQNMRFVQENSTMLNSESINFHYKNLPLDVSILNNNIEFYDNYLIRNGSVYFGKNDDYVRFDPSQLEFKNINSHWLLSNEKLQNFNKNFELTSNAIVFQNGLHLSSNGIGYNTTNSVSNEIKSNGVILNDIQLQQNNITVGPNILFEKDKISMHDNNISINSHKIHINNYIEITTELDSVDGGTGNTGGIKIDNSGNDLITLTQSEVYIKNFNNNNSFHASSTGYYPMVDANDGIAEIKFTQESRLRSIIDIEIDTNKFISSNFGPELKLFFYIEPDVIDSSGIHVEFPNSTKYENVVAPHTFALNTLFLDDTIFIDSSGTNQNQSRSDSKNFINMKNSIYPEIVETESLSVIENFSKELLPVSFSMNLNIGNKINITQGLHTLNEYSVNRYNDTLLSYDNFFNYDIYYQRFIGKIQLITDPRLRNYKYKIIQVS